MKKMVAEKTMLRYPNSDKPFFIHTDASDVQLRVTISQSSYPVAYFSCMLTKAQKNYTTTDKELRSIVKVLKEFLTILYGHQVEVQTDHKNRTHQNTNHNLRILRQHLILEEYGVNVNYIKGIKKSPPTPFPDCQ